jgi:hypothetical protein
LKVRDREKEEAGSEAFEELLYDLTPNPSPERGESLDVGFE